MTAATDDLLDTLAAMIDAFVWQTSGPRVAALAVLGQPAVAQALDAADKLHAIRQLHQPRTWAGSDVTVCNHCNAAYPCPAPWPGNTIAAPIRAGERYEDHS